MLDYARSVSRILIVSSVIVSLFLVGVSTQPREEIPVGAASLAFVFDITGSMYDDLVQVIEGAAKILATTLSRSQKPLYNYVLVPFHDPGMYTHHTILHELSCHINVYQTSSYICFWYEFNKK